MNKKILLGCLFAASVLTTTTSCSDFLDEDPKGQMSEANVFKSQADLDASIHTIYEKLNQTQSWTNPMYPQWQGDDMTANPSSNKQAVAALDVFSSDGANKGVTGAWSQHFALIKACNWVIENASKTPTSQEEINIALGNAHFWRAYAYFYLVRVFGPLPMVLKTDPSATNVAPSSVEEIYNLIVEDLKKAEGWLPTSYSKAPRNHDGVDAWVTKQATQATLTAVYMAMAGYPLNKGKEYYALAAAKAKEVIDNNGTYGFYNDPVWNHVYSMGHNYNKETILGIDNNWNSGSWDHDSELTSCCRFEGLGDGGWGDAWGEIAFWKRYPEGPRKDAVYAPKITFQDGATITKVCNWWDLDAEGKPVVEAYHPMFAIYTVNCDGDNLAKEKFAPYNYLEPNYTNMTNGRRHRLIRYAEVLLWYAESAARSGGDLAKAKEYLREVRKRAVNDVENVTLSDGTKVAIANMTADQLAEACYIEHGWEVAGNWVSMVTRRADELRMNELKKNFEYRVTNAPVVIAKEGDKEYTAQESVTVTGPWSEDRIYCPYPTTDGEKNPNLKH